jgi:hypothetical protein
MELLAIAVYSFSTLGKGFDEVMPRQRQQISSQNNWKCRRKIAFSQLFGEKIWWHRMVCGKSLDTATLKRSVVLENRINILSLDIFLLWIFIELNSLSIFENWWKTKKLLAVNVLKHITSDFIIYELECFSHEIYQWMFWTNLFGSTL